MFNIFSKKEALKSEHCYTIKKHIVMGGKTMTQTQFATEHYVISEAEGKLMYFSSKCMIHSISILLESLLLISLSPDICFLNKTTLVRRS